MATILGISAFFHDSSAAIVIDGKIVAAIAEERLTRIKHDASFPLKSIHACMAIADITISQVNEIVYYEKPFTKFERIFDTILRVAPFGFIQFARASKHWLQQKIWVEDSIRKNLNYKGKISYCQHHMSHAALAAYTSPYDDAAVVIIDAVGERSCTTIGLFENNIIHFNKEQRFPHSVGLLYSAFTYFCGFKVNSGEYKLMGLAPYGHPWYADLIRKHVVSQSSDGAIKLNLKYFNFHHDLYMTGKALEKLLGIPRRKPEDALLQQYKDIAASIQSVTEELVLTILTEAAKITKKNNLLFSGGVALNCVINEKILKKTPFKSFWIPSASGDSGCALGAALWRSEKITNQHPLDSIDFIGPDYSDNQITSVLNNFKLIYNQYKDEKLYDLVSEDLAKGLILAWFQGRMEYGPRALGNRSILAHPGKEGMHSILNTKIKKRENFRPFAPIITQEAFDQYFDRQDCDYTRMTTVACAKQRQNITACVHIDGTSRVQEVKKTEQPTLHAVLKYFEVKTGIPVLINTSFNERGEPMVCSPEDAVKCFFNTDLDVLVMERYVIRKEDNLHIKLIPQKYDHD